MAALSSAESVMCCRSQSHMALVLVGFVAGNHMAVLVHRLDKARDLRGDIHSREHESQKASCN